MTLNGYKIYKLLPQFSTGAIKRGINISKITFDYIKLITIIQKEELQIPERKFSNVITFYGISNIYRGKMLHFQHRN